MELSSIASPHTSHQLQPLDVRVFGPLQHVWQNHCASAMDEMGVRGNHLAACHKTLHACMGHIFQGEDHSFSMEKEWALSPLNPEVFTQRDFGPSITSQHPSNPSSWPHSSPCLMMAQNLIYVQEKKRTKMKTP